MKIGFIGVGAMGHPIARLLQGAGHTIVTAKHSSNKVSLDRVADLESNGAIVLNSVHDLPIHSDVIISILPSDIEVNAVYLNEEFKKSIKKGTVIIDMTSCNPNTIIDISCYYTQMGCFVIDAPVSGGVSKAEKGSLTIFASGERSVFDSVRGILEIVGEEIFYVGKIGNGKTIKSLNQMMVAINLMGLVEALSVMKSTDVNPETVYDVIKMCSGNSYIFEKYFSKILSSNFEPGFKLKLMMKDLRTAMDIDRKLELPISEKVYDLMSMLEDDYERDISVVSKLSNQIVES